ncbi:hypothetical protein ES703_45716 [subsurface metagenome]
MKVDVIHNEDCLEGMKRLSDKSIDLIACDPQYGWSFMGKDWDKAVPSVDIWKECLRVLKPGAFAFIMSGPRLDCLIENGMRIREAGFVISFTPIFWAYGSGFPKAQNIGKAVDKRGANHPDELRRFKNWFRIQIEKSHKTQQQINDECGFTATSYYKTDGKDYWTSAFPTPEKWKMIKEVMNFGNEWDNFIHRYCKERGFIKSTGGLHGGSGNTVGRFTGKQLSSIPFSSQAQALDGSYAGFQPKPAVEVIIVAMKPLSEKTYADQALKNRKGITWLDEGRIPYKNEQPDVGGRAKHTRGNGYGFKALGNNCFANTSGRFSANLLVSDDVLNDGRNHKSGLMKQHIKGGQFNVYGKQYPRNVETIGDSGSFSRYFSLDTWFDKKLRELPESVQKTFPFLIVPKASKAEKNRGCEKLFWEKDHSSFSYHQIDRQRWIWLGKEEERIYKETSKRISLRARGNIHPTVKPLKLGFYLATIGSREGDIILDPFGGSGWMAIVAKSLRRRYIVFETIRENIEIATKRLDEIDPLFTSR